MTQRQGLTDYQNKAPCLVVFTCVGDYFTSNGTFPSPFVFSGYRCLSKLSYED